MSEIKKVVHHNMVDKPEQKYIDRMQLITNLIRYYNSIYDDDIEDVVDSTSNSDDETEDDGYEEVYQKMLYDAYTHISVNSMLKKLYGIVRCDNVSFDNT